MLSRASLKEMDIAAEHIDKILEMHGASIENLKSKAGSAKESLVSQIKALKDELAEAKDDSYKAKYNAELKAHKITADALRKEQKAHEAAVADYTKQRENAALDSLVKEVLEAGNESLGKMHPAAMAKAMKDYDRGIVRRDPDGNIENRDEVLAHFAAEWKDFFGKVQTQGIDVGSQYGSQANPAYTREAIARMSVKEINKNWDQIKNLA